MTTTTTITYELWLPTGEESASVLWIESADLDVIRTVLRGWIDGRRKVGASILGWMIITMTSTVKVDFNVHSYGDSEDYRP